MTSPSENTKATKTKFSFKEIQLLTAEERDKLIEELSAEILKYKEEVRPIDDKVSRYLFEDPIFCQNVVRIAMGIDDLQIKEDSVATQKNIRVIRSGKKDVDIDLEVYAEDIEHNRYNIEIQQDPRMATVDQADFHRALMRIDERLPDPDNAQSPRKHVIFICEKDPSLTKEGKLMYRFFHSISDESDVKMADTDTFINCSFKGEGNSPMIDLAHDFVESNPDNMKFEWIAQPMRVLKSTEGNDYMPEEYQQWLVDLRNLSEAKGKAEGKAEGLIEGETVGKTKKAIESAKKMLRDGVPFDKIASYVGLSVKEVESLQISL